MRTIPIATLLFGGLLLAGCSAPQAPSIPSAPPGMLEAQVTLPGYRTQELFSDISTISCTVRQSGPEVRQELGLAELELGKFRFELSPGTASVRTEVWSRAGASIGRTDSIVGIRSSQVTLLLQKIEIGGQNGSFLRPLTPLPLR